MMTILSKMKTLINNKERGLYPVPERQTVRQAFAPLELLSELIIAFSSLSFAHLKCFMEIQHISKLNE